MIVLVSTHAHVCKERDEAKKLVQKTLSERDRFRELWSAEMWANTTARLDWAARGKEIKALNGHIASLTARLDARDRVVESLERQIADLTQPRVEGGRFGKKVRS